MLGALSFWVALPAAPHTHLVAPALLAAARRGRRRLRGAGRAKCAPGGGPSSSAASASGSRTSRRARASTNLEIVFTWSSLIAAMFVFATPLIYAVARRDLLGAQRRREHRPRGDDAHGLPSGASGVPTRPGSWITGVLIGMVAGGLTRARARVLLDPPPRGPDHQRHGDLLPRARHHRVRVRPALRRREHPGRRNKTN